MRLVVGEEPCRRLVVVAAHPDDESLGAGGLIATAAAAGVTVYVVLLTAGEASRHAPPGSTRHSLARVRLAEMENALARLAPESYLVFLGAPDGQVGQSEEVVARSLIHLLRDGSGTLLVAPWRHDGHDDHDAAGRAAAVAAEASGARLLEYPLLGWPVTMPGSPYRDALRRLDLTEQARAQKAAAIRAHVSQVGPADDRTDGKAPLPRHVLAHFDGPTEHYVELSA